MQSNHIPARPWEQIASDLLEFGGKTFLVIFDYFSKWIEILPLVRKTSQDLINMFKFVFSYHGIPELLLSDNMPYSSFEFKKFCFENGILQKTSSPRYPRGNSIAERAVGIAKAILKKDGVENLHSSLLIYRNTPIVGLDFSPAQLLMGRNLKDKLPIMKDKLIPNSYNTSNVSNFIKKCQEKNKYYYDRGTVDANDCVTGDNIYFKLDPKKSWRKGRVIERATTRSYVVQDEQNNQYRRNREHIFISSGNGNIVSNSNLLPNNSGNDSNLEDHGGSVHDNVPVDIQDESFTDNIRVQGESVTVSRTNVPVDVSSQRYNLRDRRSISVPLRYRQTPP
uniref:Uncharacterized protein K02A2.6 n=1 Tax=Cacopsylla melanoneura TaxID=428564 RepID=A0A8D9AL31_9HEMI